MQNFQEIQQKALHDAKSIIEKLQRIDSAEDLKESSSQLQQLQEIITFLSLAEKYREDMQDVPVQIIDNQETDYENEVLEEIEDRYIAEEEVIFNNTLNQIDESEIHHPEIGTQVFEEEAIFNNELNEIQAAEESETDPEEVVDHELSGVSSSIDNTEESPEIDSEPEIFKPEDTADYEEIDENIEVTEPEETASDEEEEEPKEAVTFTFDVAGIKDEEPVAETADSQDVPAVAEPAADQETATDERGKIVDIEREEKMIQLNAAAAEIQEQHQEEKKFKLANIKGLKKIQSLFEDDPLEEEEHVAPPAEKPEASLLKANMPTDFMEAEKPKAEFRLDLNDRISFAKMLFGGSQVEMNETINTLNSFKTLAEAKEYLSEVYYKNKWEQVDEYAQRLWSLVEHKFI